MQEGSYSEIGRQIETDPHGSPDERDELRLPESRFFTDEAPMEPIEREDKRPDDQIGRESIDEEPGEQSNLPFSIAGEVSKRGILWKELPVYPRDLQKEVTLKFRFWVQPDGAVQNIIPLQKGDPRLEQITVDALSSWKFAPLPPASQQIQEGVITFIYRLH